MKPRQKRMVFAVVALVGIAAAAALVIQALQSNMAYFFSPTQVLANEAPVGELLRVGGMVKDDSLQRSGDSLGVDFISDISVPVQIQSYCAHLQKILQL